MSHSTPEQGIHKIKLVPETKPEPVLNTIPGARVQSDVPHLRVYEEDVPDYERGRTPSFPQAIKAVLIDEGRKTKYA